MTPQSNPILEILSEGQSGLLIKTLGDACDLSEDQCRQSLEKLVPDIARRISDHIEDDDDLEELVDILDREEQTKYLDDRNAMFSRDIVHDGKDILELVYGSLDKAHDAAERIGPPKGVDDDVFERLMTIVASLTFAAMARRNQHVQLAAMDGPKDGEQRVDEGFFMMIINALITGFMEGARQSTTRRRRRKRSMLERIFGTKSRSRRRRRSSSSRKRRSRRRKTPSLKDILGDILD